MKGKKETYQYQDGRDFRLEDGRNRPGYMTLYRDEFLHLYNTCSKTAIGLYGYVGTMVSGNPEGFNVGGKILQDALGAGRSTLYEALGQLEKAGLVERFTCSGRTVIRLVDVWKSEISDTKVSEISDHSRPKVRTNRENNSLTSKTTNSPLTPQGEKLYRLLAVWMAAASDVEQVRAAYAAGDHSMLVRVKTELAATGWKGTMRKRDILEAMLCVSQNEGTHSPDGILDWDKLQTSKNAYELENSKLELESMREHLQTLHDLLDLWSSSGNQAMVEKTQRDIDAVALQIAELDVAPVTNGAY